MPSLDQRPPVPNDLQTPCCDSTQNQRPAAHWGVQTGMQQHTSAKLGMWNPWTTRGGLVRWENNVMDFPAMLITPSEPPPHRRLPAHFLFSLTTRVFLAAQQWPVRIEDHFFRSKARFHQLHKSRVHSPTYDEHEKKAILCFQSPITNRLWVDSM